MVIIIKPTYACNLRCKYCYLSDETKTSNKFDIDFAKNVVIQVKNSLLNNPKQRLTIIWHGGEPLLWGIKNYEEIFEFMKNELAGYKYKNSMQTNLSLITEEYIDLFLKYDIHVGFSLDGTKEIHDSQRVNKKGKGTFDVIIDKIALCKRKKLSIGCIVVGSKKHIGKISELYQFMCDYHLNFKLNPIFNAGEAKNNIDEYGLTADEYATMSIELFDLWFYDKEHKNVNSNFVEISSNLITGKPSGCLFGKNCQENFMAISPTGDVFPCGRFCDNDLREYAYGNLHTEKLVDISPKIKMSNAYKRYEYIENSSCKQCEFFSVCHGGCLHDGFLKTGDFQSKTFLCGAYKRIFAHIQKRLKEVNLA